MIVDTKYRADIGELVVRTAVSTAPEVFRSSHELKIAWALDCIMHLCEAWGYDFDAILTKLRSIRNG